jgi:hypothetical protein
MKEWESIVEILGSKNDLEYANRCNKDKLTSERLRI